jgi:hypothetical protein
MTIIGNPHINIVDTLYGASCYHDDVLVFILIPRKLSIQYSYPKAFINAFEAMAKGRPERYSDQGRKYTVLFEGSICNYVNIGIATARGIKGFLL